MSILEGIRIALTALAANKMRSALTTLGVIIGVAAVIAMVGLGQGAQKDVQERISKLGSNLIFINPGKGGQGRIFMGFGSADTLTFDDAKAMRRGLPFLAAVAPEVRSSVQFKYGTNSNNYQVIGSFAEYAVVHDTEMAAGRFFSTLDEAGVRRVCVIGNNVANDLLGGAYPIGKTVKLKGIPFTVIGVMAPIGGFGRADDTVLIPIETFLQRVQFSRYVRSIAVTAADPNRIDQTEDQIRRWLRIQHRLRPSQDDDFSLTSQEDIASTVGETNQIFTLLLAGIASISLVVGGIGIMNIMLVTVTERTREIGIRKALGAKQRDIRLQFLIESVVLSVCGGLAGTLLGVGLAMLIKSKGITTYVSPTSVLLAFGCAAGIGIFFGYYPANQAGKLDPIQALRYE